VRSLNYSASRRLKYPSTNDSGFRTFHGELHGADENASRELPRVRLRALRQDRSLRIENVPMSVRSPYL